MGTSGRNSSREMITRRRAWQEWRRKKRKKSLGKGTKWPSSRRRCGRRVMVQQRVQMTTMQLITRKRSGRNPTTTCSAKIQEVLKKHSTAGSGSTRKLESEVPKFLQSSLEIEMMTQRVIEIRRRSDQLRFSTPREWDHLSGRE